jgi:hypothetical protein
MPAEHRFTKFPHGLEPKWREPARIWVCRLPGISDGFLYSPAQVRGLAFVIHGAQTAGLVGAFGMAAHMRTWKLFGKEDMMKLLTR